MTTLITGISGFTGTYLAKKLLERDEPVVGLIHDVHPTFTFEYFGLDDEMDIARADITHYRNIERVIQRYDIDTIYHLAAQSIVKRAQTSPINTYKINVMGTVNVLEAARITGVARILIVSTDKIYGETVVPFVEYFSFKPVGVYESSKAAADIIARAYASTYDMNVVVSRSCNIYGPLDTNPRIIPNTIRQCLNGERPLIYEGVNDKREYIYVEDVADAYIALIDNIRKTRGDAFNIGTGEIFSQEDIVLKILEYFPDLEPVYVKPRELKEMKDTFLDSGKIRTITTWDHTWTFEQGLKETIQWWKDVTE